MGKSFSYSFRGLGAGYVAITYTAASIPFALHPLGKEQLGLWGLEQQIFGYLMRLDLNVSFAVSRFIAARKDKVNSDIIGSLLLMGPIVFAPQGLLIALGSAVFYFFAPAFFSIPPRHSSDFTNVLIIITFLAGLSVVSCSLGSRLWAFQRMGLSCGLSLLSFALSNALRNLNRLN